MAFLNSTQIFLKKFTHAIFPEKIYICDFSAASKTSGKQASILGMSVCKEQTSVPSLLAAVRSPCRRESGLDGCVAPEISFPILLSF